MDSSLLGGKKCFEGDNGLDDEGLHELELQVQESNKKDTRHGLFNTLFDFLGIVILNKDKPALMLHTSFLSNWRMMNIPR